MSQISWELIEEMKVSLRATLDSDNLTVSCIARLSPGYRI
uniref:Uncharacterized protein n=1 Tax=Anguilla anguilla TaxID=7936 RepID=A0A0E9UZV6_ANGAN